jgi:AcrR family transcriptional regulator
VATVVSDRRELILSCSAELFATKGVASTTVRDIGQAAGVFSGSLYHYFSSKNAIVGEVLAGFMRDIQGRFERVEQASQSPDETVRGLIRETLHVIEDHPNATAIYQNDRQYLRDNGLLGPVDEASRAVREHWLRAIRKGVRQGMFRSDIPAEVFYRAVRDTLWATTHWPARKSHSTDEFAEMMIALFFQGFATSG